MSRRRAHAWEQRRLGDWADVVAGGTPDTNNPSNWDGEIDWYTPGELTDNAYLESSRRKITRNGLLSSSAKLLPAERTILFTSRATIGEAALIQRDSATNQGFQSLVLRDEVDRYFIFAAAFIIRRYAIEHASGSTFLEVGAGALRQLRLHLPGLTEQRRIGAFARRADTLIALHQRVRACC